MGATNADNPTFVDLVNAHYEVLYRYAYRLAGNAADAEDVTQTTFLTAQRKLDQLREPAHARSWLFTIARNTFLKSIRSKPADPVVSLDAVGEPIQPEEQDLEIDSERLQSVLDELSEEFRTPLILYYFKEFSYKDIARQMDLPMGTVMSRLARGKAFLRRRLANTELAEILASDSEADSSASAGSKRESSDHE